MIKFQRVDSNDRNSQNPVWINPYKINFLEEWEDGERHETLIDMGIGDIIVAETVDVVLGKIAREKHRDNAVAQNRVKAGSSLAES